MYYGVAQSPVNDYQGDPSNARLVLFVRLMDGRKKPTPGALEPRPTRQGYNAKVLAELLNAKPREIKSLLSGQLASGRTQ